MWRSNNNADNWCLWSDVRAQNEDPFVALGCDYDGAGFTGYRHYDLADFQTYFGPVTKTGRRVLAFNKNGEYPGPIQTWEWNVTSKRVWDDAALQGLQIRLEATGDSKGFDGVIPTQAGHARFAPAAALPRWRCSQLTVYVEAADPPVPNAAGGSIMVA
jgi:hypothetical protein